ncbi:MAG: hypothetical protein WD227_05230 [Vicinamibacterales bacterium]
MIDRVLSLPERRAARLIVGIGLLFALAYGTSLVVGPKPGGRVVIGDALHHYVQLRSAVFDGDLHFENEYVRLYGLQGGEPGTEWVYEDTPTGHVRNLMPVGPALLWTPLFLLITAGVWLANLAGAGYPLDGYARLFQATAGFSGIAAATAGVWLSWRACAALFTARAAAWSCLVLWLASSALYYSVISPTYSHAASLLATSAFWYVWLRTRGPGSPKGLRYTPAGMGTSAARRYILLGLLAGVAALMRWQDAILLAPIALDLLIAVRASRFSLTRAAGLGLAAVAAAALAFVPQMLVWLTLYGQPLAMPQGGGFMRWTEPALISVLFSDFHGLFTWTPVVAIAVAGLVPLARRDGALAAGAALFLVLSWYVNAAVADWWAGEAFGARRFVSGFPVLALALAALIDRWRPALRTLALVATIIVVHTGLLLVQYQAFMHGLRDIAPYPRGAYNLWVARFVVPFDLLREWLAR